MLKKVLLLFLIVVSVAFGKVAYRVESLDIVANIQRDGSVQVEERAIYDVDRINGILYNIDALGYGKLTNLKVFYEENGGFKQAENTPIPQEGNYTVSTDEGVYRIKLYAPTVNEKREFLFTYTLTRGVTVYRDIAQLNRKMVGSEWQTPIRYVRVRVNLPEVVPKDEIYAFGHGPLTGNIEILDGKSVQYTLDSYVPREFLEVNLLFPKSILTEFNPLLMKNEKALDRILNMEKQFAQESNKERRVAIAKLFMGRVVFGIGAVWWIVLVVFIYQKNSKRYRVENEYGEYFRELPDDYSPAVAGTLLSKRIYPDSRELFATLLNLVRKGCIQLEEGAGKTVLTLTEKNMNTLTSEENFILNWYIRELGDGQRVILEELETTLQNRALAREYNGNYERWKTMVYTDMLSKGLKLDKRDKLSTTLGVITGVLYFMGGGFLINYFRTPLFLLMVIMGFVLLPYTFSRKRASLEKEKAISRWKAFKKFLVDYSNLEEARLASIEIWEHYFVYAVALGVADKVAKGYKKIMAEKGEDSDMGMLGSGYGRVSLLNLYLYSNLFRNIERNTEYVAQRAVESIAKSSMSSMNGSGGGFSGGSSGGGGGRSGGGAF